ncbi:MAG: acyltransferase family protein [Bacteroidales bacterium]|nr:acyltransferase family protein [Bacteroidales bacterium]
MQQQSSGRVAYLDVIRIVATFGVIALHVFATGYHTNVGTYNWYVSAIGDSLVRWSVPLFVMISGALFLQPAKEISYSILLRKYIPRLVLAYVFWSLSYSAVLSAGYIVQGRELRLGLLMPHFHLWYLPMLMGVYLLIPLLRKIVTDEKLVRAALVLWLAYLTGYFCKFDMIPQIGILFRSNRNAIIGYVGYFLLGYYVSKRDVSRRQSVWIYILGALGAIVGIGGNIIMSYLKGEGDGYFLHNLGPHVIAMSLALFVFIKQTTPLIERKLATFLDYVRKDLFGIYLTHALWLMVITISPIRNLCNQLITLPSITIAIFVLSLYTTKAIRAIPLLRKTVE